MTDTLRVGFGIDNVLYPFNAVAQRLLNTQEPILQWKFWRQLGMDEQEWQTFYHNAILDGSLYNQSVITYKAKETLDKLANSGHKIVLCTARGESKPPKIKQAAQEQTIEWLRRANIEWDELIFCVTKTTTECDIFFDDSILVYQNQETKSKTVPWLFTESHNINEYARRIGSFLEVTGAILHTSKHLIRR